MFLITNIACVNSIFAVPKPILPPTPDAVKNTKDFEAVHNTVGSTPGVNPGETPGISAGNPSNKIVGDPGFTPGVNPGETPGVNPGNPNHKIVGDPGSTPGVNPGETPGINPGNPSNKIVGDPGSTPGVNPGETPGINPGNPSNKIVGDPGFIPGVNPGETPGINPGNPNNSIIGNPEGQNIGSTPFTPGVNPGETPGINPGNPSHNIVGDPGFTPGVNPGETPGINPGNPNNRIIGDTINTPEYHNRHEYEITRENREKIDANNTREAHIKDSTDFTLCGNVESRGMTITRGSSMSGTGAIETHGNSVDVDGDLNLNHRDKIEINGDLNESSTSTTRIAKGTELNVHGNTTLGGKMEVESTKAGEKIHFIDSTGPIKGSYDSISIVGHPELRGRLIIIGDPEGYIMTAPASYTLYAQNQNQTNVATALDSFIPATSGDELIVSTGLDSLTAAQYPAAFNAIMPVLYQSLSTIAFNIDNAQNQELIQRLWGVRLAGASEYGGNFSMSGLAENTPLLQEPKGHGDKEVKGDILRPAPDNHWGMFVDGNGVFAQANSANLLSNYNAESGGVTTGLTYRWNKQVSTGLYTGYQGVYSKYSGGSTLIDNQVNFGLFGTYGQENGKGFFVDALAGGAYDNYLMNRNISFGDGEDSLHRTARGTPGAGELNTMVATGYDLKKGNFTFGPLSSLQYQYFGTSPFTETGAESLNLTANSWNTSSMIYSLGGHLAYSWQAAKNLLLIPQISLSWQHQFLENPYSINSTLDYGRSPSFANRSSAPLRDTLYTGIGFTLEIAKCWDTSFFYNAAAGNQDLISQNIFWSLGVKF